MPRFTLKVMLIVIAVVALWLSTIADYPGGYDLRYSIVLLIVVASGLKAYCSSGRQKCFWLAFSLVLLAAVWHQGMVAPRLDWVSYALQTSTRQTMQPPDLFGDSVQTAPPGTRGIEALAETIKLVVDLILATSAGFIALYIYDNSRTPNHS
jgi:hypothetical protein